MRRTGISWMAAGPRYNASVASNAASVNLSERTALARGSLRQAAIASRRPSKIPAWGPPSSLSPENATASTPLASASATDGSPVSPHGARSSSSPLPRSYRLATCAWRARPASSVAGTSVVKPVT